MEIIDFNEITRYNDWPTRLINQHDLVIKKKSRNEILREFGKEKWYQINQLIEKIKNLNFDYPIHLQILIFFLLIFFVKLPVKYSKYLFEE